MTWDKNDFHIPQPRRMDPEEAFDKMVEAYEQRTQPTPQSQMIAATGGGSKYKRSHIAVEEAKRMFVDYVMFYDQYVNNVQTALQDHLRFCTSAPPFLLNMRTYAIKNAFEMGHVLHCDRRSGKTTALFDAAEEISSQTHSRVALFGPYKEPIVAEASRRRLREAKPNQFARLEFIGENELHKLEGLSHDVVVDEWFGLQERTRETLRERFRILAAVGTYPHCTSLPVQDERSRRSTGGNR